jgi:hypothetical protein
MYYWESYASNHIWQQTKQPTLPLPQNHRCILIRASHLINITAMEPFGEPAKGMTAVVTPNLDDIKFSPLSDKELTFASIRRYSRPKTA